MRKSEKLALGGVITSVCVTFNVLAAIIPSLGYVLPALAGMTILILVFESGYDMGTMAYFSVSVLSLLLCADKFPAVAFMSLLGFYPLVKLKIESKFSQNKFLKIFLKWLVFNIAIVANWWIEIKLFSVPEEAFYIFDLYIPNVLWGIANVMFLMYDRCINNFIRFYLKFLQSKIRKIIKT